MRALARLGIYGAGLVVAFGSAFGIAGAAVPASTVAAWNAGAETPAHGAGHEASNDTAAAPMKGLPLEASGYVLSPIETPQGIGTAGELKFQILTQGRTPLLEFATEHEQELHLIVVRSDGAAYRHEHPELDKATGTWSMPWTWEEAGSYRIFADFTPAATDATAVTLTRAVDVAGDFTPVRDAPQRVDHVDGFEVSLDGILAAGGSSELSVTISRGGKPVTTLQPYLGAFGHMVALREGDLGYLHVHAGDDAPRPGETAGPKITFGTEAPTVGRYLLYLDFQVDGKVHTAQFVLDAAHGDTTDSPSESHTEGH